MNPAVRVLPNTVLTITCIAFLLAIPHLLHGQAIRFTFDASTYRWPNSSPGKVISADFDNDTKDEIIVASPKQKKLYIWEGIAGGEGQSWRMKDSIPLESRMLSFCIGDIDGDSKNDIITLSDRKGNNSIIDIFLNGSAPGSIKFEKKYSIGTNGPAYDVAAEDLDGDNRKDLIVADFDKKSLTFLGNATDRGMISFSRSTYNLGIRPNYFVVKDINGDKKPDLIISDYDKNAMFVLQNSTSSQASISFTQVDKLTTGSGPIACAVEDLDGNKMPDIAVANLFGNSLSIYMSVSSPNGQAHFADANVPITIKRPSSLAAGDLDGDGMPEIAVTSEEDNNTVILKNYSSLHNISLDKISEIPVGKAPQHVYMKKAGKSKQLDLIVSNSRSDNFLVLKHLQEKERPSPADTVVLSKQDGNPTEKITIYPNPASSIIHISFSSSAKRSGPMLIRIINASGQEVTRERHDATNLITMDISRLAAGFYWCQISSPGHYPQTLRLIVE
ncbi:T9SS type A sorting domain-containing protein [Chitinophaga oryzae]|uniref:T9SS type A sorting domain-containing protein n=1 Tax=Chitinophaga oryzae TaxID=2725414 RepID=A0AAE6ZF25_9BACT|nr:T9SS type A sorting domain-containing protein [Chitinophaga oryzae]QJB30880.1 T9SS type A sorting domain-containing protein [Chitinophaga oryzae]